MKLKLLYGKGFRNYTHSLAYNKPVLAQSCQNPLHVATTMCASDYLKRSLVEVALIRMQNPIQLSQYSEPEPDIAIVRIDSRK
ncbi:hypothetical protein [Nostoc sp.]|uniref:hypothetical protein n=1 Tax=Nostoc sp. TaxID=1180 RepID=UPI002FF944B7